MPLNYDTFEQINLSQNTLYLYLLRKELNFHVIILLKNKKFKKNNHHSQYQL